MDKHPGARERADGARRTTRATIMDRAEPLLDFYRREYEPARLLGGARGYKDQFTCNIRRFGEYLGRPATLEDLQVPLVSAFLASINGGRAAATVNTIRKQIIAIWRFANQRQAVATFPEVRRVPEPERIPQAWTTDELGTLLATCAQQTGEIDGIPAGAYWTALHRVWWDTGERRGAAMSIERDRVDLAGAWILVPAEVRKGGQKEMVYRIRPATVQAIRAIWEPPRRLLFPWPLCVATFYHRYTRLLREAGLPSGRRSKPQRMRVSFASHLEAAGGNATDALRHSSRAITKRSYLDPRIVGGQNPTELLPDIP